VLEQIKKDEDLKTIPVVVFTTSSNPKDIEVCYRYGVNGYILKPIDIKKLMRTLQVFIDYWFESSFFPMQQRVSYDRKSTDNLIIDDCPEDRNLSLLYRIPNTPIRFGGRVWENGLELCSLVKPDAILLDFLLQILMGWSFGRVEESDRQN